LTWPAQKKRGLDAESFTERQAPDAGFAARLWRAYTRVTYSYMIDGDRIGREEQRCLRAVHNIYPISIYQSTAITVGNTGVGAPEAGSKPGIWGLSLGKGLRI